MGEYEMLAMIPFFIFYCIFQLLFLLCVMFSLLCVYFIFKVVEGVLLYYENANKWKLIHNYYYISCHRICSNGGVRVRARAHECVYVCANA